ncbi:MAG TPA: transposase [Gemmataceae bacterium]|nr:transposase [Gemmataceae bacterium]
MDRYWFLTWRTYGTWLPGDERGFVDPVLDEQGRRVIHNVPGTALDADNPRLRKYAQAIMKGPAVYLTHEQAAALLEQFQETARYRGWELVTAAILPNHVHLIVGVNEDPNPASLLRDFKSYGSRRLNRRWPIPVSKTWWAESGSHRILKSEENRIQAMQYVLQQSGALLIWAISEANVRPDQPADAGRSPTPAG